MLSALFYYSVYYGPYTLPPISDVETISVSLPDCGRLSQDFVTIADQGRIRKIVDFLNARRNRWADLSGMSEHYYEGIGMELMRNDDAHSVYYVDFGVGGFSQSYRNGKYYDRLTNSDRDAFAMCQLFGEELYYRACADVTMFDVHLPPFGQELPQDWEHKSFPLPSNLPAVERCK